MKLFVDTAHVPDIEALLPLGIVDGVTTNPSLLAREGGNPDAILRAVCGLVQGPVSAEVVSTTADEMVREGAGWPCSTSTSSSRSRSAGRGSPRASASPAKGSAST